ncbi:hypothetical protein EYF80_022588 [Liparis tanakae]|uniref:Uncharacterized protein n=1 Tax=Liparis tanakae TaxID=230148 RepID=A0A4Z2HNP1_9TELE|nr:hypothetical protein EYF80_022588 [Liparis tanakae]
MGSTCLCVGSSLQTGGLLDVGGKLRCDNPVETRDGERPANAALHRGPDGEERGGFRNSPRPSAKRVGAKPPTNLWSRGASHPGEQTLQERSDQAGRTGGNMRRWTGPSSPSATGRSATSDHQGGDAAQSQTATGKLPARSTMRRLYSSKDTKGNATLHVDALEEMFSLKREKTLPSFFSFLSPPPTPEIEER